jgi:DNA-3-methyladenine glycosylase
LRRLDRAFFERYTPAVAKDLVGCTLVRELDGVRLAGRIVEVEAYRGGGDPASHAYHGVTKRNALMFGKGGMVYVYFTYGFHHCLNLTTEREGRAGAVLLRAIEPLDGLDEMRRRRGVDELSQLTNGPGKLTKALGIDLSLNGTDAVTSRQVYLVSNDRRPRVAASPRVGISSGRERSWRFFVEGNPFVSKVRETKRPRNA